MSKRYGRQWVLRDFNDQFVSGEVIGIQGRNGSGKSTLLRLLCSQLTPSRGAVAWHLGQREVGIDDRYRYTSWTGPYTEFIEEFTIEELLAFHFGLKPLRADLRLEELPERMELGFARRRKLSECSSGMRQRVLLGTALYAATPLLMLDEPTVTLDGTAREWFRGQLTEAKGGRLVVIASNDEEDLRQCTRRVTLKSLI